MSTWSFYDRSSGLFTGASFTGSDDQLAAQLEHRGAAFGAYMGAVDHLCQRVDLQTGSLQNWQPPPPPADEMRNWVWNTESRRWVETPTLAARKAALQGRLQAAIETHERAQARPMRELLQALLDGKPAPAGARAQLESVAGAIASLRARGQAAAAARNDDDLDRIQVP